VIQLFDWTYSRVGVLTQLAELIVQLVKRCLCVCVLNAACTPAWDADNHTDNFPGYSLPWNIIPTPPRKKIHPEQTPTGHFPERPLKSPMFIP